MEQPVHPTLDSVTTIRDDGSRRFLYPADVRGRLTSWRRVSGLALIVAYLLLPWIRIGGYPAVFLDLADRRFHLFGLNLAPQDLWLLFFLISGLGFTLFFVTALFGRLWCGWACPQTIFLDHLYRRIERAVEGDAAARRALAAAPWTAAKFGRRLLKHALYIAVSGLIVHLLLAYFVSLPRLWAMVRQAPGEHWGLFVFTAVATGVLYFNFGWFREQLCIVLCPYGRLQSALIDEHSLIIGYDGKRGEPRMTVSEAKRTGTPLREAGSPGDCVDCHRCVQVCPTGIDIRNGLQMECIGCAACIDACDDVMTHLHRPRGLIRYDSLAGLGGRQMRWFRPRTAVYALLLLAGSAVATWAISTVQPASLGITRMIGGPYFVDRSYVRNQFLVRVVNKEVRPVRFTLSVGPAPGGLFRVGGGGTFELPPLEEKLQPLVLEVPRAFYHGAFVFGVDLRDESGRVHLTKKAEFLGPDERLLREEEP